MPELFGIYNLILSIVLVVITLADLGINSAVLKYVSESLEKGKKTATKAYLKFLIRIKGVILAVAIFVIAVIARPLAYSVYNKPELFIPLILSCIYIFFVSFYSFFKTMLYSFKDLRKAPYLEAVLQVTKIVFAILAILLLSGNARVSGIFLGFALSAFLTFLFLLFVLRKKLKLFFGKSDKIAKNKVLSYMGFMGIAGISSILFGSIDTLILGKFVSADYVGYYRAALSLILAITVFFTISNVLLPVFSQINDKRAKRGFRRIMKYLLLVTIPSTILFIFIGKQIISVLYGASYLPAVISLSILSLLIIPTTISQVYISLFQSREKTKFLAKTIIAVLIVDILLTYFLVKFLSTMSPRYGMIGASVATVLANVLYMKILYLKARKEFKIGIKIRDIVKPLIASGIMAGFLLLFNFLGTGIVLFIAEMILAVLIYAAVALILRAFDKEDVALIKSLRKSEKVPDLSA